MDVSSNHLDRIVCPFIAQTTMTIDASAAEVALAQQTVTIKGIKRAFDVHLTPEQSYKLLNSFCVSGGMSPYLTEPSSGTVPFNPLRDGSNDMVVTLDDPVVFSQVLVSAINNARDGSDNSLNAWLNTKLTETIYATIARTLGVSVNVSSTVTANVEAGVLDLSSGLGENSGAADARCGTLYLQIPQETINLYTVDGSGQPTTAALPLKKGDTLVFVFDIDSPTSFDVSNVTKSTVNSGSARQTGADNDNDDANNDHGAPAEVTSSATGVPYEWNSLNVTYTGTVQRVSFAVRMAGTDGTKFSVAPAGNVGTAAALRSWGH
jgi:hypothetical protein